MKLFLATQRDLSLRRLPRVMRRSGIRRWLYVGEDTAWRVRAELTIGSAAERLSLAEFIHQASWSLRQPYLDWIGELSQLNAGLDWWASELAVKNPYMRLFARICALAAAKRWIAAGTDGGAVLVVCSTPALADGVARIAEDGGASLEGLPTPRFADWFERAGRGGQRLLRGVGRRARSMAGRGLGIDDWLPGRDPALRRRVLSRRGFSIDGDFSGEDAVLLFTWVDARNFASDGRYRDPHLGPLGGMLAKEGYRVAYVPRVLPALAFEEAVDRLLATGERFFFPELYVSQEDLERCRKRAARFHPSVPDELAICGLPVASLARENLEEKRADLAQNLTYEALVANLSRAGVRPRQIVHTCEGHGWEQVLAWSVRRYMPGTKVVGYDNGNFSRMALCMYPARSEFGIRPLPDRIVTNGPLYRRTLLDEGLPPCMVSVGCALRHPYLWEGEADQRVSNPPSEGVTRVLVATSMDSGDAIDLVWKAVRAFGGDPDIDVVIKCHPGLDSKLVLRHLGGVVERDNVRFVSTPMSALLPAVDVMLYTYSVVCFEALYHGVPPVFVKAESFLSIDQLDGAPEIRWEATTPEDLRRVVQEIQERPEAERRDWEIRARALVGEALPPISQDCVGAFIA
ncbi:MAG: hypothetical protein IH968_04000 [Gemmatimonadetes bacterium]|nr:hypothetical protein [Gemmatimonadota bacterium]